MSSVDTGGGANVAGNFNAGQDINNINIAGDLQLISLSDMRSTVRNLGTYLDQESYQNFIDNGKEPESLRSLRSRDQDFYINQLKRKNGDRAPGTFEWIMQTTELKRWLGQEQSPTNAPTSRILWLYGSPGVGKSTLAITIIEELQKLQSFKEGTKSLAYFFCTSSHESQRTADAILETLIYQFITQKRQLIEFLPPDLEKAEENSQVFDAMWSILMKIGNHDSTGEKYCIIDGLNECEENGRKDLLRQIGITFDTKRGGDSAPKINILVLSRLSPEVTGLEHLVSKDIALYPGIAKDLQTFVERLIDKLRRKKWPRQDQEKISQILLEKAGGTFLWVGIVSRELMINTWIDAPGTLKTLPVDLNLMFQTLLDDVRKARVKIKDVKTLEEIIILCSISYRPLSLLEMAEACELCPGEDDEHRSSRVEEDIKICHLMRVTQERSVELLHQSVRDFLLVPATNPLAGERQHPTDRTRLPISELDAHALMANRCIAVLLRNVHSGESFEESQSNGFLLYAMVYWMHHASMADNKFLITDDNEPFFRLVSKEREAWLKWYRFHHRSERIPKGFSIFHIAARWGIRSLAEFALSQKSKSEKIRWFRRYPYNDSHFVANSITPLEEAARAGKHEIMVIFLQNAPTTMDVKPAVFEAAAAHRKHGKELIGCLLESRQKHQIQITANVLEAVARNKGIGKEIMELLLDRLGNKAEISENLVKIATSNWKNTELMALLLKKHRNLIKITKDVVRVARKSKNGEKMMDLLMSELERRSQFDGQNGPQTAAWNGIKKQLLADQASASCANRWGWTPLHAASWHGDNEAIELLLSKYAVDTLSVNHDEWTALDAAFAKQHMASAQLLLKHDSTAAGNFTPTGFSETRKSNALKLSDDKLEVNYIGRGKGEGTAGYPGVVYANKPISPIAEIFYFEIKVISLGGNVGNIAIGLGKEDFPSAMPGWDDMSWGYHGDDGKVYHNSRSRSYAERFEVGDIIGCRLRIPSGIVNFKKNGQWLGDRPAFDNVHGRVFPVVAMNSVGARIRVNFGGPFEESSQTF